MRAMGTNDDITHEVMVSEGLREPERLAEEALGPAGLLLDPAHEASRSVTVAEGKVRVTRLMSERQDTVRQVPIIAKGRLLAEEGLQDPGTEDGHQVADLVETKRAGQATNTAKSGLAGTLNAGRRWSDTRTIPPGTTTREEVTYLKANQYRRALIRARNDSFLFQMRTSPVTPASLELLKRRAIRLVTAAKAQMSAAHESAEAKTTYPSC